MVFNVHEYFMFDNKLLPSKVCLNRKNTFSGSSNINIGIIQSTSTLFNFYAHSLFWLDLCQFVPKTWLLKLKFNLTFKPKGSLWFT